MTSRLANHGRADGWDQGLLVSVRDADEAVAALAGATIVDVKEPSRGPLGQADASVAAGVLEAVGDRAVVTLACGELAEGPLRISMHVEEVLKRLSDGVAFPAAVKAGPSRLGQAAWLDAFRELTERLPADVEAVAVAYADWEAASCLAPDEVFDAAARSGAGTVLVDTYDKTGPGLMTLVDATVLVRWMDCASVRGLSLAVAGKLTLADVMEALRLGVNVVGVRSAACSGGRLGRLDPAKMAALGRLVTGCRTAGIPTPPGGSLR